MEDLKLVLSNGQEIALDGLALPLSITVSCDSMSALNDIWEKLNAEGALSEVKVLRNGSTCNAYKGVAIDGFQTVVNGDDTLTVHFYMHDNGEIQETENSEYVQVAKILLGEV